LKARNSLIFILLSAFSISLSAQNLNTDSLKSVLPTATGTKRLNILNELGTNLREIDQELAFTYLIEAEKMAISQEDLKAESKAKENISWIYYRKGQWQRSFEYAEEAYRLALESSSLEGAARVLNNMGALHYEQQNFELAILKFKEAYRLSLQANDLYTQLRSLNNVAFNFTLLNQLDSAMYFARKSIDANDRAGKPYLTSFANRVIGDVYLERNQLDSAAASYQLSLELAEKQGIIAFKASLYHRLGKTYLQQGRINEAESILKSGIALSSKNSFLDELQKSHKVLAAVYEAKGDIRAAFVEQSKYINLNDSLLSKETKNRLTLLQGMFENDLKRSEFELLKAQNENQATRLQFVNRTVWVISIAGLLILGLGIWLFRLNKKTLIQNKALDQKSRELLEINQTKNKLFSIVGHDLRGPVGQVKSIVDLLIGGYLEKEEFEQLIHSLKKDVDSVYLTLNNTLKWSLAQMDGFKVNRESLDLSDLVESSLVAVGAQINQKNIQIHNSIGSEYKVMADLDLMEIVIRNIINNSIKFSSPGDSIYVTADRDGQKVKLCIKDHGLGMSNKLIEQVLSKAISLSDSSLGTHSEKGTGLGLQICKEFAKMNGGGLTISSEQGKGTKVCLILNAA